MILSVNNIEKSFADELILNDVCLTVNENDRIGLVGANGTGKTTLLNIICKKLGCDKGEVSYKSGLSIGYLEQGSGLGGENTIWDEMRGVFSELFKVQNKMRDIEEKMTALDSESCEYKSLVAEYSHISGYFEQLGGYDIDVKIKTVLNGMGFLENVWQREIKSLSGGEKTRLALAKLLLEQPELLILDEPTNHLDFKTLMWLEDYLGRYTGALILVSHDRYFLDKLIKTVWDLSGARIEVYKGNYSKYKQLKDEWTAHQQKEYDRVSQKREQLFDYAQKNIVRASTSKMAKSRLKQLEKLEMPKKPKAAVKPPRFSFKYLKEPVKDVLKVEHLRLCAGDKTLAEDISFTVRRSEKVAIIGDNGAGKSTLLKALVYSDNDDKHIKWGMNVSAAYYDQENKNLDFDGTLEEQIHNRFPSRTQSDVRTLLGAVGITDDNVFKTVSMVSGGERAKLGLAIVSAQNANTLLLDEPTNHLDLISKEAIEKAMVEFDGTLIFVSHDRYFLNSVPTRIIELANGEANFYDGGFDDYLAQKQIREAQSESAQEVRTEAVKPATESQKSFYKTKEQRSEQARRRARIKALETLIAENEAETKRLEAGIADPENAADYGSLSELCSKLEATRGEYDALLEEWMKLTEE